MPASPASHELGIDATALLRGLLSIIEASWVAPSHFDGLARDLGLTEDEPVIQFMTGLRGVLSGLPERVFPSEDSRRAVFTALQDALDAAIDREEASAEQQFAADGVPAERS